MTWIQTYAGKRFDLLHPMPDMVCIEDIAHALAHLCRFGGHSSRFYSVAEHSVNVSWDIPDEHALAGLLHDAAEAYVLDVPTPLKALLPDYRVIEQRVQEAVSIKFRLSIPTPAVVRAADLGMLLAEKDSLMAPEPESWGLPEGAVPSEIYVYGRPPASAKRLFLERFEEVA